MNQYGESRWTEEMVARLDELFAQELTYAEMASALNVSRSAIAGKVRRLKQVRGLLDPESARQKAEARRALANARRALAERRRREKQLAREMREAKRAQAKVDREREDRRVRLADGRLSPAEVVEFAKHTDAKTLMELSGDGCRAPVGREGGADQLFCGNRKVTGLSYCLGCAPQMYRVWPAALKVAMMRRAEDKIRLREAA